MLEGAIAAIRESTVNTLYYTLSTIAQTLSGAFALMAAFVVFKLQFTTAQIADAARPVAKAAGLVRLRREGKFQDVYDRSESAILAVSSQKPYLATLRRETETLLVLYCTYRRHVALLGQLAQPDRLPRAVGLCWDRASRSCCPVHDLHRQLCACTLRCGTGQHKLIQPEEIPCRPFKMHLTMRTHSSRPGAERRCSG